MMIMRKHLHRRTFLKGMGAAIALPMLDAMTPAFAAPAALGSKATRLAFTYVPNGITMVDWTPAADGAAFEFTRVLKPLEAFRKDTLILSGLAHKNGEALGDGPGDHARAAASVPDRRPPAQDGRRRYPERHLGRSDCGPAPRRPDTLPVARARVRRLTDGRQLRFRLLAARTRTAWPGVDLRRRCRRKRTRASCSSASLAMSTPACPRTSARGGCSIAAASSIWSLPGRRRWRADLGPADRRKLDEYLTSIREIERRIEMAEQDLTQHRPDHRQAVRHPGAVRRVREIDVRPAGGRVPDRPHACGHDDDGTRRQPADLSGNRRARSAPSAHAPPRQSGVDREGHQDQHAAHGAVRRTSSPSSRRRPTATARCSITR